jgi:hypothetical protein
MVGLLVLAVLLPFIEPVRNDQPRHPLAPRSYS